MSNEPLSKEQEDLKGRVSRIYQYAKDLQVDITPNLVSDKSSIKAVISFIDTSNASKKESSEEIGEKIPRKKGSTKEKVTSKEEVVPTK